MQQQISFLDSQYGKMSNMPCPPTTEQTSKPSSKRSAKSQEPKFMYLSLKSTKGNGPQPELSWEMVSQLPGASITPSVGAFPSVVRESSLSQILEANVPEKYSLTPRASQGILRRATKRGKNLPTALREALEEVIAIASTSSKSEPESQVAAKVS